MANWNYRWFLLWNTKTIFLLYFGCQDITQVPHWSQPICVVLRKEEFISGKFAIWNSNGYLSPSRLMVPVAKKTGLLGWPEDVALFLCRWRIRDQLWRHSLSWKLVYCEFSQTSGIQEYNLYCLFFWSGKGADNSFEVSLCWLPRCSGCKNLEVWLARRHLGEEFLMRGAKEEGSTSFSHILISPPLTSVLSSTLGISYVNLGVGSVSSISLCLLPCAWTLTVMETILGQDTFIVVPAQAARFGQKQNGSLSQDHDKQQIGFWRS